MPPLFPARRGAPTAIAVVSTYPPTRCGLATFSASLIDALRAQSPTSDIGVLAIDPPRHHPQADMVAALRGGAPADLDAAARALHRFDAVVVQHEYGIYAGDDGVAVIGLLDRMATPAVTVLHTVLERPSDSQRRVLEQVVERSAAVVVMADVARDRILRGYGVDASRIHVIPHGSMVPRAATNEPSRDRPTLLTWGLLGPGKGVEAGIDAMVGLRDLTPRPRYLVAGQTHPKVRERSGESYRAMLAARAEQQGVGDLVEFDDRYLDRATLAALLHDAVAVVLPYESDEQVTSGVLVDAVAAGRPVVATAFPHAVELLGRGAGLTVPHADVDALTRALRAVLSDDALATELRHAASRIAPELSWGAVARRYLHLIDTVTTPNVPVQPARPTQPARRSQASRAARAARPDASAGSHAAVPIP